MNKKKPIYRKIWFWAILIVPLAVNISFSCLYSDEYSNIFTAVSGWVSGIATAVLGVIAVLQNERYEKDNKEYLKEQKEIQMRISEENKKQNEFSVRLSDYNNLSEYHRRTSDVLFEFLSSSFKTIVFDCYERYENNNIVSINEISEYIENQRMKIMMITMQIRMCHYSFKYRNELIKSLFDLSNVLFNCGKYGKHAPSWDYLNKNLREDIDEILANYLKILELSKLYLIGIQTVLDYLHDDNNSFDECKSLLNRLTSKKESDEEELNNYVANQITEDEDA